MGALDVAGVQSGIQVALSEIESLNVYGYQADGGSLPMAQVLLPREVVYDYTAGRGTDRATFPVLVLVGRADDESANNALAGYLNGSGATSIKAAVEDDDTLGGACESVRVVTADVAYFSLGAVECLGALFDLDVEA